LVCSDIQGLFDILSRAFIKSTLCVGIYLSIRKS